MNRIIEQVLNDAWEAKGLSTETCNAIKNLLDRQLNDDLSNVELNNDIARVYDLIKGDLSED